MNKTCFAFSAHLSSDPHNRPLCLLIAKALASKSLKYRGVEAEYLPAFGYSKNTKRSGIEKPEHVENFWYLIRSLIREFTSDLNQQNEIAEELILCIACCRPNVEAGDRMLGAKFIKVKDKEFIGEHAIPIKVIAQHFMEPGFLEMIMSFPAVIYINKKDDAKLREAGLTKKMLDGWDWRTDDPYARYEAVGIREKYIF